METLQEVAVCKNCQRDFNGNYCSDCGHPRQLERISWKYVVNEIGSIFNFEKGFFYTVRELLLRPGLSVRNFLQTDRSKLVKPVTFAIICSFISLFSTNLLYKDAFHIPVWDEQMVDSDFIKALVLITTNYYDYILLFNALFIALGVKMIFRKHHYNYFEILILIVFLTGTEALMGAMMTFFTAITGFSRDAGSSVTTLLVFVYFTFAIGNFFGKEQKINYLKSGFAYTLGILLLLVTLGLTGFILGVVSAIAGTDLSQSFFDFLIKTLQ